MEYLNEIAVNLLVENGSKSLPVDMLEISSKSHEWLTKSYLEAALIIQELKLEDYAKNHKGFSLKEADNDYMILYSDELSFTERNFVIAHEIAHIILGHSTVGYIVGKAKNEATESIQEAEADAFASYLLAPASILLKAGILSSNSIRAATAISDNYLLGKADEIAHLRETNLSPAENRLCKQFKSYILRQRLQKYRKYGFSLIVCAALGWSQSSSWDCIAP